MKKLSLLLCLLCIALTTPAASKADATYQSIRQQYRTGRISADSVVSLAVYHKVYNPQLAEQCLKLVNTPRSAMELGVIYAFSPEFSKHAAKGVKLLQHAAQSGQNEANCYLGLYYFNHKDYAKAKSYLEACNPQYGIGYTALGSMYTSGTGVKQDLAKARENFRQAALKGYPRGMALYGFNLRANAGGAIDYPDSFYWLYIAGDLGEDAARVTLFLPTRGDSRGDSETARQAFTALQFIEAAQSGKKIQNEPIYREGFLPSLKAREKAAEQGDDWARFYLGSMNYNGDFLNQNYAQVLHYYVPIAQNSKLPRNVLAVVNQRLAELYRDGKGTKADPVKAERHTRLAAHYGSLPAYKIAEHITD